MDASKFKQFGRSVAQGFGKIGKQARSVGSTIKNKVGGAMDKVASSTKDIAAHAGQVGEKFAAVAATLIKGIKNPLVGIMGLFAMTLKYMLEWEGRSIATARATGLMGQNLREAQSQVATLHEKYRFFGEGIDASITTIVGMNNALGNVDYTTQAMADNITQFSIGAGISKDTSAKLMSNFMLMQGTTEKVAIQAQRFAKDLANAAGVPINLVMDDLANISDSVAGYLGSNPEELVRATVEARRFGMSLDQAAKIADSLLDFESSIEKEMEAQILTGKTLNYDKARQLALSGDIVGAAKDIVKQVGGIAEFNKMNVIQQKALAGSVGLGVVEMKKMLGVTDKEAELEEKRAEDMRTAQMDQAKGVKIIATTMEGLNRTFHRIGLILTNILKPVVADLMSWLQDPETQKKIEGWVNTFVAHAKPVLKEITEKVKEMMAYFKSPEGKESLKKFVKTLTAIKDVLVWIGSAAASVVVGISDVIGTMGTKLAAGLRATSTAMLTWFSQLGPKAGQSMGKIFGFMAKGLKTAGKVLLKVFKALPVIGSLISFGFAIKKFREGDWIGAGMEIVSGLAKFIPGVGTAVGMAVDVASISRDMILTDQERVEQSGGTYEEVSDFILRPGQRPIKFNKGDLIAGGTNLGSGDGDLVGRLDAIIDLLKAPGVVLLDGRKVGESLAMVRSYVSE